MLKGSLALYGRYNIWEVSYEPMASVLCISVQDPKALANDIIVPELRTIVKIKL